MRTSLILMALFAAACGTPETSVDETVAQVAGTPDEATLEILAQREGSQEPVAIQPLGGESGLAVSGGEEGPFPLSDPESEELHHGGCVMDVLAINVRHGETLTRLAGWTGVPAEEIASVSGIDVQGTLYAGQELWLPITEEQALALESTRNQFEDGRLEGWLEKHGGLLAVSAVALGTRDTVWGLARESGGLPLWVVAAFNRGRNLDRLNIGDEVYLPVVGSMVTISDAGEELETQDQVPSANVEASGDGLP